MKTVVGQTFVVTIPADAADAGLTWQPVANPRADRLVRLLGDDLMASAPPKDGEELTYGGPAVQVFTFQALVAGTVNLEFVQHRGWVEPVPADPRRTVSVRIAPGLAAPGRDGAAALGE